MSKLLTRLMSDYKGISFQESSEFCWSPTTMTIMYNARKLHTSEGVWAILHELGHALLDHNDYGSDIELLQLEAAAWEKAQTISKKYNVVIDTVHVQDCMDTYRDWLHLRSACPQCDTRNLQQDSRSYLCYNCNHVWHVSASRFCRPYRMSNKTKTSPLDIKATFV